MPVPNSPEPSQPRTFRRIPGAATPSPFPELPRPPGDLENSAIGLAIWSMMWTALEQTAASDDVVPTAFLERTLHQLDEVAAAASGGVSDDWPPEAPFRLSGTAGVLGLVRLETR